MADAEWLADVAADGMVRPSLVLEIQRLGKIPQNAGVKITSFTSKVLSVSSSQRGTDQWRA